MQKKPHNARLLQSVDFGMTYKKLALKHEETCIPTCQSHAYNKFTMNKYSECQNAYHHECLKKETSITLEHLKYP